MALPIAVQLYSVRGDAKEDFYGTLTKIKEMGYDGVEFAGLYDCTPAELARICKEIGLVPVSAHVPFVDLVDDTEKLMSDYETIGCKFIAIPFLKAEHRPGGENFDWTIENVKKVGTSANAHGITLLYHNHDFEFIKLGGKYGLDVIYERVPADLLKTELDTCWVNIGGEDPADYIRKYAGRCPVVHLKDFNGEKSENMYELIGEAAVPQRPSNFEFRPVGSGLQDIPAILKASEESGALWVVVEQDNASMGLTPMESIKKSIDYLRSIGY